LESGRIVLTGDDPEEVLGLWEDVRTTGAFELPRIDTHQYGDLILDVSRTPNMSDNDQSLLVGDTDGDVVFQNRAQIRYRYDISSDGLLTAARAYGPEVDLEIAVSAEDKFRCQYGDRISFVDTLQHQCEQFAAEYPELVIDCDR
jgi:hypothetical protein